jgi:hypothetical protein
VVFLSHSYEAERVYEFRSFQNHYFLINQIIDAMDSEKLTLLIDIKSNK